MKGDIPAAAFRLCTVLPVVTHRQPEPDQRKVSRLPMLSTDTRRPVRIGADIYPSMTAAREARHCAYKTIYKMILAGEAEYI